MGSGESMNGEICCWHLTVVSSASRNKGNANLTAQVKGFASYPRGEATKQQQLLPVSATGDILLLVLYLHFFPKGAPLPRNSNNIKSDPCKKLYVVAKR